MPAALALALAGAAALAAGDIPAPALVVELERSGTHVTWALGVGTPPRPVAAVVDTGSADLIVRAGFSYNASASVTAEATDANLVVGLFVDQERVRFINSDRVADEVRWPGGNASSPAFLYAKGFEWTLKHAEPPFEWAEAEGVLGMAYQFVARLTPTPLEQFLAQRAPSALNASYLADLFALNIGRPPAAPRLEFFGLDPSFAGDVQWAYRSATDSPHGFTFPMFDASICGARVLGNVSAHIEAIIDTGASCLGLPAEMFDSVALWAGLDCGPDSGEAAEAEPWRRICRVPEGEDANSLPTLSFRVAPGGAEIPIPLSVLALEGGVSTGRPRLCLERMPERTLGMRNVRMDPMVSIGAVPMQALYAAFDRRNMRVGLASSMGAAQVQAAKAAGQCARRARCRGHQLYFPPSNECLPPPCESVYLFMGLDASGEYCEVRPAAFSIAIGFVLAAFAALEYVVTLGTHDKLLELAARLRVRDRSVRYPAWLGPRARWVRASLVGGEDVYHRHEDDAATPPRAERALSDAEEDAAGGDSDSNDSIRSGDAAQPDAAAAARGPSLYDSVLHLRDFWRRNM